MAGKFKISGDASGTFESKVIRGNPLTCHLESMAFFDGSGNKFDPSQGVTVFEYLTYDDNEWREWDLAARNDYGDGLNYPSRVTGKLIRKVRVTFSGFPANTTFIARFYHLPVADGSLDARVQNGDQALTIQPFTEQNSKDGLQFYKNFAIDALATSGTRWTIIQTGNKDVLMKTIDMKGNNELFDFTIFEGTDFTPNTPLTVRNYNLRDTVPASTVTVYDGVTVNANGTQKSDPFRGVGSPSVGGRAIGSARGSGIEFVWKKNTVYGIRQRNLSATNTLTGEIYTTWYEGPISVDI